MKWTLLFVALCFGDIAKTPLPRDISAATTPSRSWVDDNDESLLLKQDEMIDTINDFWDSIQVFSDSILLFSDSIAKALDSVNYWTDTVTVEHLVSTDSSLARIVKIERDTSLTNNAIAGMHIVAKSTGDMVDGFGGRIEFAIEDDAGTTENVIGNLIFDRDGADNEGSFVLRAGTDGSDLALTIESNLDATFQGSIDGDSISTGGNERVYFDRGSFTADFSESFSGTETTTIYWQLMYPQVILTIVGFNGTSNVNHFRDQTGSLPSALRPATTTHSSAATCLDDGNYVVCSMQVRSDGDMEFFVMGETSTLWTTSGTKAFGGVGNNTILYNLL